MSLFSFVFWFSGLALAGDTTTTACDGLVGSEALTCIERRYPEAYQAVEALCADPANEPRRTCRVKFYGERGIAFVGNQPRDEKSVANAGESAGSATAPRTPTLNRSALTGASITLGVAGAGLQMVPSICAASKNCHLTESDVALITAFSGAVSSVSVELPSILTSDASDADKAARVIGLAKRLEASLPTGLSDQAHGMIQSGLTSVQGLMPLLFSLGENGADGGR